MILVIATGYSTIPTAIKVFGDWGAGAWRVVEIEFGFRHGYLAASSALGYKLVIWICGMMLSRWRIPLIAEDIWGLRCCGKRDGNLDLYSRVNLLTRTGDVPNIIVPTCIHVLFFPWWNWARYLPVYRLIALHLPYAKPQMFNIMELPECHFCSLGSTITNRP